MKITAFRHMISDGLGSMAQVLEKNGGAYEYIDTYKQDLDGFDALAPDLLIVLGGSPGVYQADDYPFIKDEIKIIEKRIAADKPTLGICLGAQMMAKALGANVYPGAQGPELGWFPLTLTEAGAKSPVRHLAAPGASMLHWHGDTFDMPEGATLLASSAKYEKQAYSYGRNILGLQCHAEMTPCILKGWFVKAAPAVYRGTLNLTQLRAETEEFGPRLMNQAEIFLSEWLAQTSLGQEQGTKEAAYV